MYHSYNFWKSVFVALTHCKFANYVINYIEFQKFYVINYIEPLLELKLQKSTDFATLFPAPDNA